MFVVQYTQHLGEEACRLCGQRATQGPGPQLCLIEGLAPVCASCGRKHEPGLTALLELAQVAERVGRVSAHSGSWVPLGMLFEIAQASESYYSSHASEGSAE